MTGGKNANANTPPNASLKNCMHISILKKKKKKEISGLRTVPADDDNLG